MNAFTFEMVDVEPHSKSLSIIKYKKKGKKLNEANIHLIPCAIV